METQEPGTGREVGGFLACVKNVWKTRHQKIRRQGNIFNNIYPCIFVSMIDERTAACMCIHAKIRMTYKTYVCTNNGVQKVAVNVRNHCYANVKRTCPYKDI